MRLHGRIPGRSGLWELSLDGARIEAMSCRDPAFDGTRAWITPGLFDLQINGIAGVSFTSASVTMAELAEADAKIRERGVSRYCPTLITCARETLLAALATFERAWSGGAIPGAWALHLEGPWISSDEGYRGVHRTAFIRDPDPEELDQFQERSGNRIRLLTLAPERRGAELLIRHAASRGITVSLGHTRAQPDQIREAVRAGARMSTHLWNGCARLLDRHENVVFSQLAEDALFACFIADGHHVPLPTLRIGMRAKGPARSILVSDLAHLSGLPEGEYEMEGNRVELHDGGIWVKGSWLFSGAARTLDEDVAILARQGEPGIEQALLMATRNPAVALGCPQWTEIVPGREGPLAVFSWDGASLRLEQKVGF